MSQTSLPQRNDHEPDRELGRKIGAGKFRGFNFFCPNFSAKKDYSISCEGMTLEVAGQDVCVWSGSPLSALAWMSLWNPLSGALAGHGSATAKETPRLVACLQSHSWCCCR